MLIQRIGILGTVLVTIAIVPALAKACTCIESYAPWIAEFSGADAVFVGKVHSVIPIARKSEDSFLGDRLVTFEVGKKYKGIESSTRMISLYTDYNSSSCSFGVDSRLGPRKGEMWLVLAHKGDSPQMSFGGSCNASTKVDSKSIKIIESEAFKFPQKQGILGSVVRNYMSLAKNVEVSLRGEGIEKTLTVDADGYFWFPLEQPGKYSVTAKIPFRSSLISAVFWPEAFDSDGSKTVFRYQVDLKEGEYHYNEVNVDDPTEDPFSKFKKDAGKPASLD